ncbi:MAG: hypothetical protein WCC87_21175 [Candidatus Korobacteraceae bacterium]
MHLQTKPRSNGELAKRVKSILDSKNLTLHYVSRRSAVLFGRSSPYFLPHNLYYDLKRGTFSPSLFQLFALSRISNYKLTDWLQVFGFQVESIPRLQIQLSSARTILLDSSLEDPNSRIPWLRDSRGGVPAPPVAPLSQVLEWTSPLRLSAFADLRDKGFLYAKIGYQDALAFPELLAGSIVRIKPTITGRLLREINGEISKGIFLVEHGNGLFCCHIRTTGNGHIAIVSTQLPYAQVEFRVPEEARLVGVADMEIRNVQTLRQPRLAEEVAQARRPESMYSAPKLGSLLRNARLRMTLSFRSASAMGREVANLLADERYYVSPGSLSDYEALDAPPRHFHKIITFCLVYSLRLDSMLEALGLSPLEAGTDSIPDRFVDRASTEEIDSAPLGTYEPDRSGFPERLLAYVEEVPFFLRRSIGPLSGLINPTLKDFFWIGGTGNARHPYLAGGLLAIVNRHKKKPDGCDSKPLWQQPLYVILRRDGTYLCGCCELKNKHLVVHSYLKGLNKTEHLPTLDAEVVGQIVTVVRRLP